MAFATALTLRAAVFLWNTPLEAAFSITEVASATSRPDKVIGMHFFNPAPVMKLVEIIRGIATSEETYKFIEDTTKELFKVLGE